MRASYSGCPSAERTASRSARLSPPSVASPVSRTGRSVTSSSTTNSARSSCRRGYPRPHFVRLPNLISVSVRIAGGERGAGSPNAGKTLARGGTSGARMRPVNRIGTRDQAGPGIAPSRVRGLRASVTRSPRSPSVGRVNSNSRNGSAEGDGALRSSGLSPRFVGVYTVFQSRFFTTRHGASRSFSCFDSVKLRVTPCFKKRVRTSRRSRTPQQPRAPILVSVIVPKGLWLLGHARTRFPLQFLSGERALSTR